MSRTFTWYCGVALATLIGHAAMYAQTRIEHVEFLLQAADQEQNIQDDQIRELIASLQQSNQSNESLKTQGFIAGALDTVNRRDASMAIWHSGYDRGSDVSQQAMNVSLNIPPTATEKTKNVSESKK